MSGALMKRSDTFAETRMTSLPGASTISNPEALKAFARLAETAVAVSRVTWSASL